GESLDPVTFIVSLDAACADTEPAAPVDTALELEGDDSGVPLWVWLVAGLLLVAIIITIVVVMMRRRA
ncbi:MAG TPA: hypothetical protein PK781_07415, partial [Terrimesophilobacter sp.]|nr:hypothetical protein [Terrimesophilobacter sp.]